MSSIQIRQRHTKPKEEVRDILRNIEEDLVRRFGLSTRWQDDDTVSFGRSGLKGRLSLEPDCVTIDMKLGIILGLYARTIQTELEKSLAEKLA